MKFQIEKKLTLQILKLSFIYTVGEYEIQILLTNQNMFRIIFQDSTLESNMIRKSHKTFKMCRFLQEFFDIQYISYFNEIWGYS